MGELCNSVGCCQYDPSKGCMPANAWAKGKKICKPSHLLRNSDISSEQCLTAANEPEISLAKCNDFDVAQQWFWKANVGYLQVKDPAKTSGEFLCVCGTNFDKDQDVAEIALQAC